MIRLTDVYHKMIEEKSHIHVAVDMTCGHGNDTLLLAQKADKVYGFDIQSSAIKETSFRLKDYDHVTLINDDHQKVADYVPEMIDVAIFNLGYMPGGDFSIMTKASETLNALKRVIQKLNKEGLIVLELYPHNPKEIEMILNYTSKLDSTFDVLKIDLLNKKQSPCLIMIKK